MTQKKLILIAGAVVLLGQAIFFRDYISPFYWGQLKVSGLACTCPDESVLGGRLYLKAITPDSLKKFNLDYSEIYVTQRPSTNLDPMGVDSYIIQGQVIGKDRVSEGDRWNPKFKIEKWREVDFVKDWVVRGFFFGQLIIWGILVRKARNRNGALHKL